MLGRCSTAKTIYEGQNAIPKFQLLRFFLCISTVSLLKKIFRKCDPRYCIEISTVLRSFQSIDPIIRTNNNNSVSAYYLLRSISPHPTIIEAIINGVKACLALMPKYDEREKLRTKIRRTYCTHRTTRLRVRTSTAMHRLAK